MEWLAAVIFAFAVVHTFSTKFFEHAANRHPKHAGLFHLLGEVEVVFGFWAAVLVAMYALLRGSDETIAYAESRQYTEPLFVFVIMVIAASRPVLEAVRALVTSVARILPVKSAVAECGCASPSFLSSARS